MKIRNERKCFWYPGNREMPPLLKTKGKSEKERKREEKRIIGDEGAVALVVKDLSIPTRRSQFPMSVCMRVRLKSSFSRVLKLPASCGSGAHLNPSWLPGTRFVLSFISPPIYSARCILPPPPTPSIQHSLSLSTCLHAPLFFLVNSPRIITFCHCL